MSERPFLPVDEFIADKDWRGRFGDADDRPKVSDIVDLALRFHGESRSGAAVLLSRDGNKAHAKWVPWFIAGAGALNSDLEKAADAVREAWLGMARQWQRIGVAGWAGAANDEGRGEA